MKMENPPMAWKYTRKAAKQVGTFGYLTKNEFKLLVTEDLNLTDHVHRFMTAGNPGMRTVFHSFPGRAKKIKEETNRTASIEANAFSGKSKDHTLC